MRAEKTSPFTPGAQVDAYLRDSGGDDQDLSITQQEAVIRRWCAERGLRLVTIYADERSPGSSAVGRRAFQRMMADYRHPDCKSAGIILWKYSRFARDIDDAQFYKSDLRRRGYTIHSLNDAVPEGADGRFFEAAIDWMNQRFLEDLSTDVRRGLRHLVEKIGGVPGTPPRGFMRQPVDLGVRRDGRAHIVHRWAPDPAMIERVHLAFSMRARGAAYREIQKATWLYRSNNAWNHFFSNRIYIGELRYGDLVVEDYCDPIVDRQTWQAVQEVNMHSYKRSSAPEEHPRRRTSDYILSGLAVCARCGSPLSGETVKSSKKNITNRYYACSRKKRTHECDAPLIPRDVLETAVLDACTDEILDHANLMRARGELETAQSGNRAELRARQAATNTEIARVKPQIDRVVNAIAERGHSAALLDRLTRLERTLAELEAENERLVRSLHEGEHRLSPEELERFIARIKPALRSAGRSGKRELLRRLVDKVVVERTNDRIAGVIHYYEPGVYAYERSHRRDCIHRHNFELFYPAPRIIQPMVSTEILPGKSP